MIADIACLRMQGTIRDAPPETEVEQMRKAAQRLYLEEQKYWKDNAAIIEQQIEEDKQRQLKEYVPPSCCFSRPDVRFPTRLLTFPTSFSG